MKTQMTVKISQKEAYQVNDLIGHINILKKEFRQTNLCQYVLNNKQVLSAQNLLFLPRFSYFVHAFSDLNKYILPYSKDDLKEDTTGLKAKLNYHFREDESHNRLFNEDISFFQDEFRNYTFSNYLDFLWSDEIKHSRLVSFGITKLAAIYPEPKFRYCLVRTIEELGNTFFSISSQRDLNGKESYYFGKKHFDLEPGHLHLRGDDETLFKNQTLTSKEYEVAKSIVDECYTLFAKFFEEIYQQISSNY